MNPVDVFDKSVKNLIDTFSSFIISDWSRRQVILIGENETVLYWNWIWFLKAMFEFRKYREIFCCDQPIESHDRIEFCQNMCLK